jgi:DNA-binding CsgD family transcriptional regulator
LNTHITQFSGEQTRGSLNVVALWMHATGSGAAFGDVLSVFQTLVGASGAQIVRQMRHPAQTRMIARHDQSAGKLFERPVVSFCAALFGDMSHHVKAGSLWRLTDARPDRDILHNLEEMGLKEVCILVLNTETDFTDYFELHLSRPLPDHDLALLEILGPILAEGWKKRAPGCIEAAIAGRPFPVAQRGQEASRPLLGSNNPAGLTRSEFRICTLIQSGRLPDEISEMLGVSKSTLRSHMRAIYLKTGASGQVELVHLLHGRQSGAGGMT